MGFYHEWTSPCPYVDYDAGAWIDSLPQGTFALWVKVTYDTSGQNRLIYKRHQSPSYGGKAWMRNIDGGGDTDTMFFEMTRASDSTNLIINSTDNWWSTVNEWQFAAVVFDSNGADGDQRLFKGNITTPCAEPSYEQQSVGSGSVDDDSNGKLTIGANTEHQNNGFGGNIAWVGIWDDVLTQQELWSLQFMPRPIAGASGAKCLLFSHFGFYGASSVADWSGNGRTATVYGVTTTHHVPLGPPIGFDVPAPRNVNPDWCLITSKLTKACPLVGFTFLGLLRNPKLTKRQVLNPFNWITK